jgi:hypothetical protein
VADSLGNLLFADACGAHLPEDLVTDLATATDDGVGELQDPSGVRVAAVGLAGLLELGLVDLRDVGTNVGVR